MENRINKQWLHMLVIGLVLLSSCSITNQTVREENTDMPESYSNSTDTSNVASISWREYFSDPYLSGLIDTALKNNQELNILLQEIEISRNEVRARKGEYLPSVNLVAGSGLEKEGRYTRHGAVDDQLEIREGEAFPEPLGDFLLGARMSWEVDVWRKLRNAKQAAVYSYLASEEGAHFMVTNLVAEIADAYYELMALDNLLQVIDQNVEIQSDAFKVVKQQKNAGKANQLAVNRFEAQLLNTQNLQYEIKQRIVETENQLKFLTGRFSGPVERSSAGFTEIEIDSLRAGIPAQLLSNRPDIRQAELNLMAAKLDVKVAKARFYPSLDLKANIGFQSFNPAYLVSPESVLYNLAGDLMSPLINRNGIKAAYLSANAQQLQSVYTYEQTILNAYVDVLNQLAKIENYSKSFETKEKEVELFKQSVNIANSLFNSARADYAEVLFTQREALEAKLDLIEIKMKLLDGKVNMYRALGGGWN